MLGDQLREWVRVRIKAVAAIVGVLVGLLITRSAGNQNEPLFQVWESLALGLTGTAGLLIPWGIERWLELRTTTRLDGRDIVKVVAALLVGGLGAMIISNVVIPGGADASVRGSLLVVTASIGALPAAATMLGIWAASHDFDVRQGEIAAGEKVATLLSLRRLLLRLLTGLGALVVLSTLALGASRSLHAALPAAQRDSPLLPPEAVLVFGASASLLVGLLYAPAAAALRTKALDLAEALVGLAQAQTPSEVVDKAERRKQLEGLLEANVSVLPDLQTGIIILGPLIASAGTVFLPK
jgi:hypothetical protein